MDETKKQVFEHISSEFRTPLSLMLAPLESLLMGEHGRISPEQQQLLQLVHGNSVKLLQMVAGLNDIPKSQSGIFQVVRQPIDIAALTASVVQDFQPLAIRKKLDMQYTQTGEQAVVNIDRYLYERIAFNILSNAVKFTPEEGSVRVNLNVVVDRVTLTVSDTGCGITNLQEKLHSPEYRQFEDASSRRVEGLGLGLALVKEFTSMLGGTVDIKSQVGLGTVVVIDIIAPPVEKPQDKAEAKGAVDRRSLQSLNRTDPYLKINKDYLRLKQLPQVLIAENNPQLAEYVSQLLSDLCQTRIAHTMEESLEVLYDWRPDLVLAAVNLQGVDGMALCREIKSKPETSVIPVVLLTALTQREDLLKGWEAGADEYLFKPFHPAELVTRVRSLLRGVQQRKRAQEQIERLNEALEKRVIELANANRELKSLATKLEQARDQALEASRFKSEFLANMSHEIRTPINGVISMSDMLTRTALTKHQTDIAGIIRDSAGALLDIINDILDFSKIEAGKLELEILDFDLLPVIEGTTELVADQARAKGLSLMMYIAPDVPRLFRGDPGRLRQILLNLLSNAIKFTDSGEVYVRASVDASNPEKSQIRISVTDTGIGMSQETVHRLFQPFTQADGSITRRYGGTGLGLSIAKLLTELLGGRIGVRSTEGKGSTFWVSVPLEHSKMTHLQPELLPKLLDTRVLLVEAFAGSGKIIEDYLQSWGMESEKVTSVGDAFETLKRRAQTYRPFDIVIVEQFAHSMESFALAGAVQEDPALAKTKLILCTTDEPDSFGEKALQSGFSAILVKPLRQSRLFDCIALNLNREGHPGTRPLPLPLQTPQTKPQKQHAGLILVAEDNAVNQKVALLLLKELGHSAHVVGNGREAIAAVCQTPYSLILMDCQMPEMDGMEATGEIRRLETMTGRHVPVVAMTAHAMQGDREKCIAAGMDDYISKPVTAAKLNDILQKWLPRVSENFSPDGARIDLGEHSNQSAAASAVPETARMKETFEPPPINWTGLQQSCGEDGALEILTIFVDSSRDILNRLERALETKEVPAIKSAAHELKGASASVGSQSMATICKKLEDMIKENLDYERADEYINELKSSFNTVVSFSKTVLVTSDARS
jgi:signal transduction histidine kinase/HPt (histidine-containing phosphotransfer) domain-containing protein